MILNRDDEARLGRVWERLQRLLRGQYPGISQAELDDVCLTRLEEFVTTGEELLVQTGPAPVVDDEIPF